MTHFLRFLTTLMFVWLASCSQVHTISKSESKENEKNKFATPKVIYGADDRLDLYEVNDPKLLASAQSTVALVDAQNLSDKGGGFVEIKSRKFGDVYSLCPSEPFREQPTGAFCSGFLVGKDLLVTAGHCINSESNCTKTKFVFGFAMRSPNDSPQVVNSEDIYSCKKLIHSEIEGKGADFAVVQLDREVTQYAPLKLREKSQITVGEPLTVIGHPAGIPTKIAGGANVRSIQKGYFTTNLDTYGGNSGSAVFNTLDGKVEGILVRGATDFLVKNGCRVSNVCEDKGCQGEDVTQITQVLPYLSTTDLITAPKEGIN
ncbi:MAG: trypsin-like peptidase domain-containing protein [Bdellovibrionaceae bacterium]|nr:trypsin-like peptidase domain-containing protein [Pseudobdellovibrionaceae bacterium]